MVHDLTNANVSKDGGVLSQSSHASGSRFDARVARSQDREAPCLVARHPMFPCKGSHPEPMDQDDGVGRILNIGHVSPLSLGFFGCIDSETGNVRSSRCRGSNTYVEIRRSTPA